MIINGMLGSPGPMLPAGIPWPEVGGEPRHVICRGHAFDDVEQWCADNLTGPYRVLIDLPDSTDVFQPAIAIVDDLDMAMARLTYE